MSIRPSLATIVLTVAMTALSMGQPTTLHFSADWFYFANEYFYYPLGDMQQTLSRGMANAFQINRTSLDNQISSFTLNENTGLISQLPASTDIINMMGGFQGSSASYIAEQYAALNSLAGTAGSHRVFWSLMAEYDQSGGHWPNLRKVESTSRTDAYNSWLTAFRNNFSPLGQYLAIPPSSRSISYLMMNVYSFATHYSFELGADCVVLERNNDEIGDIQTGISFVRGAARQYDKPWGIDLSTWRTATNSPTTYDANLKLTGGWSASYFRRHMYLSYMSGTNILLNEGAIYYNQGRLNPLGEVAREVSDFSLRRHTEIGTTDVKTALILDYRHGFEPKHGIYTQGDLVWYSSIPYTDGDHMTHRFLDLLFPGYWKTGTRVNGAPSSPDAYVQALANGTDPRPWEPMGESRWGDQFDVLLSNASLAALRHYKLIFLVGDIEINDQLRANLETWVSEGGTLVVNTKQARTADEPLLGIQRTGATAQSDQSTWLADQTALNEASYRYDKVTLQTAIAVAASRNGDPIVTRNPLGTGSVYFVAPHYLLNTARSSMLALGEKLVGELLAPHLAVNVSGPSRLEYIVNRAENQIIVTLVNNSSSAWSGTIAVREEFSPCTVEEWIADVPSPVRFESNKPVADVTIPAFDIKILAFNRTTNTNSVEPGGQPGEFGLQGVYPNPFNPVTTIRFAVPREMSVRIRLIDVLGRLVKEVFDGLSPRGMHEVPLDANGLTSGPYLCVFEGGGLMQTQKVLLVR